MRSPRFEAVHVSARFCLCGLKPTTLMNAETWCGAVPW